MDSLKLIMKVTDSLIELRILINQYVGTFLNGSSRVKSSENVPRCSSSQYAEVLQILLGETVYIVPYIVVNLGKGFQQSTSQVAPTQTTNLQGEFSLPA